MSDLMNALIDLENDLVEFMDDLKKTHKKNRQARWLALAAVAASITALIIRLV